MSLGYLFGGGVGSEPRGVELHTAYAVVRELYAQVAEWTGLTVGQVLEDDLPEAPEERQSVGTVRECVHAIAVYDVLAEKGLRPAVLGGLSLGGMSAACLAGAVGRRPLFEMLAHARHAPALPPGSAAQGLALSFEPIGQEDGRHRGDGLPNVFLAGVFGPTADGAARILMLSGERAGLDELAARLPEGSVIPLPDRTMAIHSPLRAHFREFMAPYIDAMPFADPELPLVSCLDPKILVTAEDVRDSFQRNATDAISLVNLCAGLRDEGARLGLVMGGSIPDGVLRFPFPVVHVNRPEHVEQVLTTVFELGIEIPAGRSAR